MTKLLFTFSVLFALTLLCACAITDANGHSLPLVAGNTPRLGQNFSAIFMCNTSECTTGCEPASMPLDTCIYVSVAGMYMMYSCDPAGDIITLTIYGPFQWMCNDNHVNLKKRFPTGQCVLPNKAGGYTVYTCPKNGAAQPRSLEGKK